jgi:hypothetical protein
VVIFTCMRYYVLCGGEGDGYDIVVCSSMIWIESNDIIAVYNCSIIVLLFACLSHLSCMLQYATVY